MCVNNFVCFKKFVRRHGSRHCQVLDIKIKLSLSLLCALLVMMMTNVSSAIQTSNRTGYFTSFPFIHVSLCGYALGIAGITNLLCLAAAPSTSISISISLAFLNILSSLTLLTYVFTIILHPRLFYMEDFQTIPTVAAIAPGTMAWMILSMNLSATTTTHSIIWWISCILWWIGLILHSIVQLRFLQLLFYNYRQCKSSKELHTIIGAYYFPPLVGIAMVAGTGVAFANFYVLVIYFWIGFVWMIVSVPYISYFVWTSDKVSSGPSISLMQAATSFITMTWFKVCNTTTCTNRRRVSDEFASNTSNTTYFSLCSDGVSFGPNWFGPILFGLSTFFFLYTVFLIAKSSERRKNIKLKWFTSANAAATFPQVATATAVISFHRLTKVGSDSQFILIYSWIMYGFAILVTFLCNAILWWNILDSCKLFCSGKHKDHGKVHQVLEKGDT